MNLTPEQLTSLMNSGREALASDDYATAEMDFEQVIKNSPLFPMSYLNCATAQFLQGKNDNALVNLDLAIALLPEGSDLTAAYHNRGLIHAELGNLYESITDLRISSSMTYEDSVAKASAEELKKMLELQEKKGGSQSDNITAKVQGWCGKAREEFSQNPLHALALFKKALDLDNDSIDAMYGLALSNSALGLMDQALEKFDEVLHHIQPEHVGLKAEVFYNRSAIYKQQDKIGDAITDLEECLDLALDPEVGFPVMGSAEQEAMMIKSIKDELAQWKKEIN